MPNLNSAPILDQLDSHWQKMVILLLAKLDPERKGVKLTEDFMRQVVGTQANGGTILLTHGQHDGILLKLVTESEAQAMAEYQTAMERGTSQFVQ